MLKLPAYVLLSDTHVHEEVMQKRNKRVESTFTGMNRMRLGICARKRGKSMSKTLSEMFEERYWYEIYIEAKAQGDELRAQNAANSERSVK